MTFYPYALRSAFLALTKHLKCDFSDDKPKKITKKVDGFSLTVCPKYGENFKVAVPTLMSVQIWWVAETFLLLENPILWV